MLEFLRPNYPLAKHLFLVPLFALRAIGLNPEKPRHLMLVVNFSMLLYGIIAELRMGIHYLPIDVVVAMDCFCPVASSIMSLLKLAFIWWYRREFAQLISDVRRLTAAQNGSPQKDHIKRQLFTLATRLTSLVLFFASCTNTAYTIRPIISMWLQHLNGQDFPYETPFKMMLPELLVSMPLYPLVYVLVSWHGYITVTAFIGADGFFLGFCLYFTALLRCLQEDIKVVLTKRSDVPSTICGNADENIRCCEELSKIIDRHNEIYDMTDRLSKIVVGITLGHFLTSSIIIGMSVLDLLLITGIGTVVYVVYTCAAITQLLLYCYGGTIIQQSSEDVGTCAYCSEWYLYDLRVQKMVLLLIKRSQRPFLIRVPFFSPSLPVLAAILRFAGSLIALANSVL